MNLGKLLSDQERKTFHAKSNCSPFLYELSSTSWDFWAEHYNQKQKECSAQIPTVYNFLSNLSSTFWGFWAEHYNCIFHYKYEWQYSAQAHIAHVFLPETFNKSPGMVFRTLLLKVMYSSVKELGYWKYTGQTKPNHESFKYKIMRLVCH